MLSNTISLVLNISILIIQILSLRLTIQHKMEHEELKTKNILLKNGIKKRNEVIKSLSDDANVLILIAEETEN